MIWHSLVENSQILALLIIFYWGVHHLVLEIIGAEFLSSFTFHNFSPARSNFENILIYLWDAVVKIIIYICLFSNILFLFSFGYTLQLKNILHIHQGINSGLPHQLILYHPLILHFIS